MRLRLLVGLPLLVLPLAAEAKPKRPAPPPEPEAVPAWFSDGPRFDVGPGHPKRFVAPGRATGPEGKPREQAADEEARQALGRLVAAWQERALRCAHKESLTRTDLKTGDGHATLSLSTESATAVAFYDEQIDAHGLTDTATLALAHHDLAPFLKYVPGDVERPQSLRDAVAQCGEKAFDELAAEQAAKKVVPLPPAAPVKKAKKAPAKK